MAEFVVTRSVNFATVLSLRAQGEQHIRQAINIKYVTFDLSQVQCTDSAVLPLLTAWLRYGKKLGVEVRFYQMPSLLMRISKVCGLWPFLT